MKVISRLSTAVFRGRASDVGEVSAHLGATFILSGAYVVNAGQIMVTAELSAARNNQVVWTDRLNGDIGDLLRPKASLPTVSPEAVHLAVVRRRGRTYPDPAAAVARELLAAARRHQADAPFQQGRFLQTRKILEELINRHGRIAAPRAWLGNWYILRVTRGWSEDRKREAAEALSATHAALDRIRRTRSRWRPKDSSTVTC